LSQLAALRQPTRLGRFSARANIRAAVWDKPRSDCKVGVSRFMESALFLSDLLTGHEPALVPERELSQLAALRQATRLSRFSARANIRAAVWDKPRSRLRRPEERRFMESSLFLLDLLTVREPALAPDRELSHCQAEVRLAALRQATRLGRFSARANICAAVWDKPRSRLRRPQERRFLEAPTASKSRALGP
jgi:hypothetical protein